MTSTPSSPLCIHQSFHLQAQKTPNNACLIDAGTGETLSYAQVQQKVLLLAQELVNKHGATTETVVAIYMEPSPPFVIAMLAILSAGAAYVPLELAYPIPMLQKVLLDATPVCVITKLQHVAKLPQSEAVTLCMDDKQHFADHDEDSAILTDLYREYADHWTHPTLGNLAFVVYSSGTTGQPKGIANPHRAPALSYNWRFGLSDYTDKDRVAANVFFVWEVLRPVMRGASVLPVPSDVVFDGEQLSLLLQKQNVTEMLFTPSLLENLFNTMTAEQLQTRCATLQTVFLNGEVVSMALRQRCLTLLPHTRFINLYSISECHEVGAVDLRDIDTALSTKFCPVGLPSTEIFILDEEQQPVPPGQAGELYVPGDMLARGYLHLPELTDSRFVPNPFHPQKEEKMYRTGDRARLLDNGHLEILGRCDFMVKIRGYSIVLGAVEAALVEAVCLTSSVVVADGEEGQDKHLVAYVVRDTAPADTDTRLKTWTVDARTGACPEIRRAIDGLLPHYMVPSVFIEVETLPVSEVGAKLDRKALQAQSSDRRAMLRSLQLSTGTHTTAANLAALEQEPTAALKKLVKYLRIPPDAPVEDVEAAMILLWEAVLDREAGVICLESDFHEQGGHSLSAARLAAVVNKVFGTHISAMQLFRDNTTVDELVKHVMQSMAAIPDPQETTVGGSLESDTELQPNEEKVLQQVRDDAVLPDDITVTKSPNVTTLETAKAVFLTGVTGFLGVHLLVEILSKRADVKVYCLVRSTDSQAIQKNLDRYGLSADLSRVVLVHGDLSKAKFGLAAAEWDKMRATIDTVVHCGAAVSLTAPYSALQPVNVNGTLCAIRLATACQAGTPLVYVSSNGVFPTDKGSDEIFVENDDIACLPGRLGSFDGYGLSKWTAERLVSAAHKRGLPTTTIRYGNIGWHSKSGKGNALDYQGMVLNGCKRLELRPIVSGWNFEVTPVDFAACALVALAGDQQVLSDGSIFNCVQNGFTSSDDIFDWMGSTLPSLSYNQWARKIEEAAVTTEDKELTALFAFVSGLRDGEGYLSKMAHLDCSRLDAELARIHPSLKRQDFSARDYYTRYFQQSSVGPILRSPRQSSTVAAAVPVDPRVTSPPTGALAGQVAVVTGASSGIGRAIVQSLVEAGCHVAMGARRLSELEKTRDILTKECPGSGSKTIIKSTDVTDLDQVASLVARAEGCLGSVDILVNCAGVMYFTLMKNVKMDQWDQTVDVNCKGTMYGIGSVLPQMLERGKGHIVNITSDAGRKAFAGLGVYSGSKFFVEAMSQALRVETASTGLRVTCIQPGNVATPLLSKSTDPDGLKEYGEPTGAKVLEPVDIGRAVVYAVSQPEWCAVNEILVEPREEPA